MDLHPAAAVDSFADKHEHALGLVGAYLDQSVQKTMAAWEGDFEKLEELPGDALSADVRARLWRSLLESPHMAKASLSVVPYYTSKKLSDGLSTTVRVRRHPWNFKRNRRVTVTEPPTWTLFGEDNSAVPFELAVLWSPAYATKTMARATLAAVSGFDADITQIYYAVDLPQVDLLTLVAGESVNQQQGDDDFEELIEEKSSDDSA